MRCLITGGCGFIGANLSRLLLERGCKVRILDRLDHGAGGVDRLDIELVEGDIRDSAILAKAVDGCDAVIHLAAESGVLTSLQRPFESADVNIIGTLRVLEAIRLEQQAQGRRVRMVFASSNAPLGTQPSPVNESTAPMPFSPYGATKLAAEAYCLAYHGTWGVESAVLRFSNVYGPYSRHKKSVIAKFIQDIKTSGAITIDGDGSQIRDFIHVRDLCEAIYRAMTHKDMGAEIFHIGSGTQHSVLELAQRLEAISGRRVNISFKEKRQGDLAQMYADVGKARRILGWEARIPMTDGLQELWEWYEDMRMAA